LVSSVILKGQSDNEILIVDRAGLVNLGSQPGRQHRLEYSFKLNRSFRQHNRRVLLAEQDLHLLLPECGRVGQVDVELELGVLELLGNDLLGHLLDEVLAVQHLEDAAAHAAGPGVRIQPGLVELEVLALGEPERAADAESHGLEQGHRVVHNQLIT
jgi:hypothetical protein